MMSFRYEFTAAELAYLLFARKDVSPVRRTHEQGEVL